MLKVFQSKNASKQFEKLPSYLQQKYALWVKTLVTYGLETTQQQKGWHDEPLSGNRHGQRSIRLNLKWRVIYLIENDGSIRTIIVEEITPHDYKVKR